MTKTKSAAMLPQVSLQEQAVRGVEAITQIVNGQQDLLAECDRMTAELVLLREKTKQQEDRLNKTQAERDYWMRYATEIVSKLNDMRMLVDNAIEASKHAPYRPSITPLPPMHIDAKDVERMIEKLPRGYEPASG